MEILFDGTNPCTIQLSIANALQMNIDEFVRSFVDFYTSNIDCLDELPSDSFFKYLKDTDKGIESDRIRIDKVFLFHKTSVIDGGKSILEKGLLNPREVILGYSPLSNYLKSKGIQFLVKEGIPYINKDGVINVVKEHNSPHSRIERAERNIRHRLLNDRCINGYLFLDGALNERDYQHIKNKSEFFNMLDTWMPRTCDEWVKNSTSYILKSEVDIGWLDISNEYTSEQLSQNEKAIYILEKALYCVIKHTRSTFKNEDWSAPIEYLYLHQDLSIPPKSIIEFIEY